MKQVKARGMFRERGGMFRADIARRDTVTTVPLSLRFYSIPLARARLFSTSSFSFSFPSLSFPFLSFPFLFSFPFFSIDI